MKPYWIRLIIACWFLGMVAFAVWGAPVQGEGAQVKYLPLMVRNTPLLSDPPLHNYLMVSSAWIENDQELFSVRADGSELQMLTDNALEDRGAVLSPKGDLIMFEQYPGDRLTRLILMNRDGSNPHVLLEAPRLQFYYKSWSPNGRWIAIITLDPNRSFLQLVLIDANSGTATELSHFSGSQAYWSPDGRYLAFLSAPNGITQLWVAPMDGTAPYALTSEGNSVRDVAWHPSANALFYTTEAELTRLVTLDGRDIRTVLSPPYHFLRVLSHGQQLLASDDTNMIVAVTVSDGSVTPLTTSNADTTNYSVSPHEQYLLYKTYDNTTVTFQPLDGSEPRILPLSFCVPTTCSLGEFKWADDDKGVLLGVYNGGYHRIGYIDLNAADLSVRLIDLAPSRYDYLPFSSHRATAYKIVPYPAPPDGSALHSIDTNTLTATPIVPFERVEYADWHYLP